MKLYLISKNPIINKLVALSASKLGVEMVESQDLDTSINAELVLIDDECFEAESFAVYKEGNAEAKNILFYSKAAERIEGFDAYIQKPFLPTDLVKTLSEISGISTEDSTKKNVESDILELDGSDDLGELNLDDELDLSNLDDLGLDDNEELNLDDGDKELSLGDDDAQLDFGGDDGLENTESNGDGAEQAQESDDLQVLDKGDVDTIKDLLDDSKEATDDPLLGFDLDKELGEITDDNGDIELSTEQELEQQKEEEQEALETAQEPANVEADSALEADDNFDVNLEDIMGDEVAENTESKPKEEAENLDLDLNDFDLGIETENAESKDETAEADNMDLNLEDFDLGDSTPEESADSTQDTELALDMESSDEASNIEDTESLESVEALAELENFDLDKTENAESEATESFDISSATDVLSDASNDEFADLSLEEMGEALGEPVQKEPIPAPLVAKESPQNQEIQLQSNIPSSIQANSLDSLIGALQTLQTQALKDLLSGATINISIQFPKKDED